MAGNDRQQTKRIHELKRSTEENTLFAGANEQNRHYHPPRLPWPVPLVQPRVQEYRTGEAC